TRSRSSLAVAFVPGVSAELRCGVDDVEQSSRVHALCATSRFALLIRQWLSAVDDYLCALSYCVAGRIFRGAGRERRRSVLLWDLRDHKYRIQCASLFRGAQSSTGPSRNLRYGFEEGGKVVSTGVFCLPVVVRGVFFPCGRRPGH